MKYGLNVKIYMHENGFMEILWTDFDICIIQYCIMWPENLVKN